MLHPIIAARRAFLAGAGAALATTPAGVRAASESAAVSKAAPPLNTFVLGGVKELTPH